MRWTGTILQVYYLVCVITILRPTVAFFSQSTATTATTTPPPPPPPPAPTTTQPLEDASPFSSELDCQVKLMSDIFHCVSSQGIDFTQFLFTVGGAGADEEDTETTTASTTTTTTSTINSSSSSTSTTSTTTTASTYTTTTTKSTTQTPMSQSEAQGSQPNFKWFSDDDSSKNDVTDFNAQRDEARKGRQLNLSNSFIQATRHSGTDSFLNRSQRFIRHKMLERTSKKDIVLRRTNFSGKRVSRSIKAHNTKPFTDEDNVSSVSDNVSRVDPRKYYNSNDSDRFRGKTCSVQNEIMQCTFQSAKALIEHPACSHRGSARTDDVRSHVADHDQSYLIREQVEAIIGQYDDFCAHPCRKSLLDDMRKCYEKFDLDPKTFMSREYGGAVIGSSSYDVDTFCKNRVPLVKCLKAKRDDCPESEMVLDVIGLDLEMMGKGFDVLCDDQKTYLESLECFSTHNSEVGYCHSLKHRKVVQIANLAHQEDWTLDKYLYEMCNLSLEHIQCDLDAWALKKEDACSDSTFDLKRRLHCSLVPPQCLESHGEEAQALCDATARPASGASGNSTTWRRDHWTYLALFAISVYLKACID